MHAKCALSASHARVGVSVPHGSPDGHYVNGNPMRVLHAVQRERDPEADGRARHARKLTLSRNSLAKLMGGSR